MIQRNPAIELASKTRLESGDRLTRHEFHARYELCPEIMRAELVEGVVYVSSPIRYEFHGHQQACLLGWLAQYYAYTPGAGISGNASLMLDGDNEFQPDGFLRLDAKLGGKSTIDADGYIVGPIELAAEVASSSASYDLGPKMNAFRRNGVQEYLVWRVLDEEIDWFRLHEGRYVSLEVDASGVLKSEVFPGLWLDKAAMLADDMRRVLEVLRLGLESPEHQRFVAKPPE